MSRVGNAPISVPSGVEIKIDAPVVSVKGAKGELSCELPETVTVSQEGDELRVARPDDSPRSRSMHGLARSLLANMVSGVSEGYKKELEIHGVGYRASLKGSSLDLALGFSHPVSVDPPEGISFEVPEPTRIIVSGADKQAVGQIAADIRKIRKPEPYKGKGIRYVGEHVRRKAGKSAVTTGA